ncbi:MAG: hypothetical protein ACOCUF_04140 [Patescibacteria group bacterium]
MSWIDFFQQFELWTARGLRLIFSYEKLALVFMATSLMFLLSLLVILKIKKQIRLQKIFLKEIDQYENFNTPTVKGLLKVLSKRKLDQLARLENRAILRVFIKRHQEKSPDSSRKESKKPQQQERERATDNQKNTNKVKLTQVRQEMEGDPEIIKKLIHHKSQKQGAHYVYDRSGRKDFGKH